VIPRLITAIRLAADGHGDQVDKLGEPYIFHPLRVAMSVDVSDLDANATDELRAIAVLHDVIEDTGVQPQEIAASFGNRVVEALDALTRRDGEHYSDFIIRVAADPLAVRVKIADLLDNMDPKRIPREVVELDAVVWSRKKYVLAYAFLTKRLTESEYLFRAGSK